MTNEVMSLVVPKSDAKVERRRNQRMLERLNQRKRLASGGMRVRTYLITSFPIAPLFPAAQPTTFRVRARAKLRVSKPGP